MRNKNLLFSAMLLVLTYASGPANALTAKDVLEKMGDDERAAYLIASVEMASFLAHIEGNKARSACITKWWFDTPGTKNKVFAVFERFEDRTPQAILHVLIRRQCSKPETAAK